MVCTYFWINEKGHVVENIVIHCDTLEREATASSIQNIFTIDSLAELRFCYIFPWNYINLEITLCMKYIHHKYFRGLSMTKGLTAYNNFHTPVLQE